MASAPVLVWMFASNTEQTAPDMTAFSLSVSAAAEIRRIFRSSECRDPVVRLYEAASAPGLFDDLSAELVGRGMADDDLRARGKERLELVAGQLESALMVCACERADFQPDDLREVDGITFAISPAAAALLGDLCLTFEDGHFLLRSGDNKTYTLRSLGEALKARRGR